jgi:hypothetical protein
MSPTYDGSERTGIQVNIEGFPMEYAHHIACVQEEWVRASRCWKPNPGKVTCEILTWDTHLIKMIINPDPVWDVGERERMWGEDVRGWLWCKYCLHMYENGKVTSVKTNNRVRGDKKEWWKGWIQL